MCLPFGALFCEIWYSNGGFSSETKEPKLHKLGVFWANYCKKHPICSKLGAFLSKMVYSWVGNLAKNWNRDSQIFEVRQAHPRTILVKVTPAGVFSAMVCLLCDVVFLPIVIIDIKNICTPAPSNADNSCLFLGGLNTSPCTSFQPVSSMVSSCIGKDKHIMFLSQKQGVVETTGYNRIPHTPITKPWVGAWVVMLRKSLRYF